MFFIVGWIFDSKILKDTSRGKVRVGDKSFFLLLNYVLNSNSIPMTFLMLNQLLSTLFEYFFHLYSANGTEPNSTQIEFILIQQS